MSGTDRDQPGSFRQRLDAILRQRNPAALREFLIGEGQWEPEARTDEQAAMWMMIAASPVLADLHAEAGRWLMAHGHEHEAQAILGRHPVVAGGARGSRPKPGGGQSRRTSPARGTGAGAPRQPRPAHAAHPRDQSVGRGPRQRKD